LFEQLSRNYSNTNSTICYFKIITKTFLFLVSIYLRTLVANNVVMGGLKHNSHKKKRLSSVAANVAFADSASGKLVKSALKRNADDCAATVTPSLSTPPEEEDKENNSNGDAAINHQNK
jgi:hypothetical protein